MENTDGCNSVCRCIQSAFCKTLIQMRNELHAGQVPSVLWRCWLGGRKGIRPVKNWAVGCWHGCLSAVRCRRIWPSWCHCHSLSLASVKFILVLLFWYWLIRVVLEKGPLNGCVQVRKQHQHTNGLWYSNQHYRALQTKKFNFPKTKQYINTHQDYPFESVPKR